MDIVSDLWQCNFDDPLSWGHAAYDNFAKLQQRLMQSEHSIIQLNIGWEGRLGRTFLFLIMCLLSLAEQYGKTLHITVSNKVYNYLNNLNFLEKPQLTITPGTELRFLKLNESEGTINMARNILGNL